MNSRKIKSLFGRFGSVAVCTYAVLGGISCEMTHGNPVHQSEVDALGPEKDGIPQGPLHRAGQPCTVCHSPEGPATTIFSIAGTIFAAPPGDSMAASTGVENAAVGIVDSTNAPFLALTNCVGNFYVAPDKYSPVFPILVSVSKGKNAVFMNSQITRETSCAGCHSRAVSDTSPGQVYLSTADVPMDCNPVTKP